MIALLDAAALSFLGLGTQPGLYRASPGLSAGHCDCTDSALVQLVG